MIVREDLIGNPQQITPTMLNYAIHAENGSMYNTPPTYSIYICKLVLEWIKNEIGGLEKMKERNERKAKVFYDFLDRSKLFKGTVVPEDRSSVRPQRAGRTSKRRSAGRGCRKRRLQPAAHCLCRAARDIRSHRGHADSGQL